MGTSTKKKGGTTSVDKSGIRLQVVSTVQQLWDDHVSKAPPPNALDLWTEHTQIRELVERVNELHALLFDVDALISGEQQRSKASIDRFTQWCKAHDIIVNGVRLTKLGPELGLGLVATKKIDEREVVIEVPRKAMLSLDQARRSPFLKKAFERDLIVQQMDNVGLALSLCCQRLSPDSMWTAYLDVLPSSFSTPLNFTQEQMKSLRPSPLYEEALLLYRNVARQFAYFLLQIAKNEDFDKNKKAGGSPPLLYSTPMTVDNFTFSLYRWAVCCVATRINMIPSDQQTLANGQPKMVPALIPMLDMANHSVDASPDAEAVVFCAENECAQIVNAAALAPTEPLLIFYGRRSNADFLLYNGFVPDDVRRPYDTYRLKIGVNKNEKHYAARIERIVQLGFGGAAQTNIFVFDLKNDEEPYSEKLIEFVRIIVASEPTDECLNSESSKQMALQWLHTRLKLLINAYEKLPIPAEGDKIAAMISRLHTGERAILQNALAFGTK